MNKAFIFDMDGVIVNSELVWERYEQKFLPALIGKDTYLKIKDQILGNSVSGIYDVISRYGFQTDKKEFVQTYDQYAKIVYQKAKITEGIQDLIDKLTCLNYGLGLVSSSRKNWIEVVLRKLKRKNPFQFILSLDSGNIKPKPSPNGYLHAIKALGSVPTLTIILEDSQRGIESAKASGALTICLREYLPKDYFPKGADIYIRTIKELIGKIDILNL